MVSQIRVAITLLYAMIILIFYLLQRIYINFLLIFNFFLDCNIAYRKTYKVTFMTTYYFTCCSITEPSYCLYKFNFYVRTFLYVFKSFPFPFQVTKVTKLMQKVTLLRVRIFHDQNWDALMY